MNAHAATPDDIPAASHDPEPEPPPPSTRAQRWLGVDPSPTWAAEFMRLLIASGLASAFGVALGLRHGGMTLLQGALGAPAGILAVAAVAVPAFAIVLALANAPLQAMQLAQATTRAAMRAGLFLAGVAPAAALLVVTVEDATTVDALGFGGLAFAGWIAASSFSAELRPARRSAPAVTRALLSVALPAFLLFAAVLAARVWWLALPVLTEIR
ncbi:MAG: hypothetical protein ACRELB_15995 [Polyangiaceae bacterium]